MNWVSDLFNWLCKIFQWWVIVLPWEKGIRIRLGKRQKLLLPGVYLKLPIIDEVFVQGIRLRYMGMPMQTLTTKCGKAISLTISVGYIIEDIELLYNSIYSPSATISNILMGDISQFISSHIIEDCSPSNIEAECQKDLNLHQYGLGKVTVRIVGFAVVRTLRLLQDQSWFPEHEGNLSRK